MHGREVPDSWLPKISTADSCFADWVSVSPTTTRNLFENNSQRLTGQFSTSLRFSFSHLAAWLFGYGGRARWS
jgi:hypothetical protein